MDRGQYFIAEQNGITFIRLVGNLKYTGSSGFDRFLEEFLRSEYRDVVIDLSETEFIDSTNLGLIARIAERARSMGKGPVPLLNPNDDVFRILKSVCFDRVFRVLNREESKELLSQMEDGGTVIESGKRSQKDELKMILRAHKSLIRLDEENRSTFQDVVDLLERENET